MTRKTYYSTTCETPVGLATLASDGASLVGLWLNGQKRFGGAISGEIFENGDDSPILRDARRWLAAYFAGKRPKIADAPPLDPVGATDFRRSVWRLLTEIPLGTTVSYRELADELARRTGKRPACQAVGGAVGRNPISILIPCHRVIGSDGNLTGYAGGLDAKIQLLRLEGVDETTFFRPGEKRKIKTKT